MKERRLGERTYRQDATKKNPPLTFSTGPLQLHPPLQANPQDWTARFEPAPDVAVIPIAVSTVIVAVLVWEPAQGVALSGSNPAPLRLAGLLTGTAAAPKDFATEPGAGQPSPEPGIDRLQLTWPRPRLSFGREETDRAPFNEEALGWVLPAVRF